MSEVQKRAEGPPIRLLTDTPMEKYRWAFVAPFLRFSCIAIVFGVGLVLAVEGLSPDSGALEVILVLSIINSFIGTVAAIIFRPVYVGCAGLHAYDFWGAYQWTNWDQIESVGRFNFLGFRHLVIRVSCGKTIWLPLYLSDQAGFRESVTAHAGDAHLLTNALRESA